MPTPTTYEVRVAWAEFDGHVSTVTQYADGARAEFDRWLNEVKAAAWDEGAEATEQHEPSNPYRTKEDNDD